MTIQTQNLQNRLNAPAQVTGQPQTLAVLLQREDIRQRFADVLGAKAPAFMTSVLSTVNTNTNLAKCSANGIIAAAMIAAALDLPVDPNLGFSYIVPYGNQAQLQIGAKGFVQLAMRSGLYRTMNVSEVYEGQIKNHNPLTGKMELGEKASDKVIGYVAYFELLTGFEKYLFMTTAEIEAHAKKYSKTYSFRGGVWQTNFHGMAMKTVLKRLLSKYGPLSIDARMQSAVNADQAAVKKIGEGDVLDAQYDYVDSGEDEGDVWAEAAKNAEAEQQEAITK